MPKQLPDTANTPKLSKSEHKQTRNTLKSFFSDGAMPTSDMFAEFIDSTVNVYDDGFDKDEKNGWKLASVGKDKSLLSFYNQRDREKEEWVVRLEGDQDSLVIGHPSSKTQQADPTNEDGQDPLGNALSLTKNSDSLAVGIGTSTPKARLDVFGNIKSKGRRGSVGKSFQTLKADGQWKTITDQLTDGVAFEIVARAVNSDKQFYGMMHAIALHSPWRAKRDLFYFLGFKNKIRYTHAFYDSMLHRLKLRWVRLKGEQGYRLQLRSNCNYGEAGRLDFHITNLWSEDDVFVVEEDSNSVDAQV
jgi:hypothetical protein